MSNYRRFIKLRDGKIINIDSISCIYKTDERTAIVSLMCGKQITINDVEYGGIHREIQMNQNLITV